MKTTIFYFSSTGNSLKIARDMAQELGDAQIVPVAKALREGADLSADRIGLVFPVYMWGVPLIVARFIRTLRAGRDRYCFAVATCGGSACATLVSTAELFAAQGMKLSSGFIVKMPGNYTPMYGAIAMHKQEAMFKKAAERVREIAAVVREGRERAVEKGFFLFNWLMSGLFYGFSAPHIPAMDKSFHVDDKCNGCGMCVKVCPVANVTMEGGKPVWHGRCEQCLACLQWCPEEALQSGKRTADRCRYHHPSVTAQDFIIDG